MCEDEMKPKNESKSGETINEKISAVEKMVAQTMDQSKTSVKNKPANKTNDYSGDDMAEGKSANVAITKSAEANGHCKCPTPIQKVDNIVEVNENNTSNVRTYSETLNTYKGRQIFESGLFSPKRTKLKVIRNKIVSKKGKQWVNTNCALNYITNGIQLDDGRKPRHLQTSKAFQLSPAMNAPSAWKPLKKSNTKNKHPQNPESAILNYLKMCPKTCDFAVQASNKHSSNREDALQNRQTSSKTDSVEDRCTRRTNAWALDPSVNDNSQFINSYPSIYVSQAGLINIFLRWGIILEVTADKVLRLVDRRQNMAIATSRKGKVCSIHHPSAKIFQNEKSADAELCGRWQVRRRMNHVIVADRTHSVWIDDSENYGTVEYKKHQFLDMSFDNTVNLPCSSST